jgi:hypothetical protein
MGVRPMVKPLIDLMLLSSMFHFVNGMIGMKKHRP